MRRSAWIQGYLNAHKAVCTDVTPNARVFIQNEGVTRNSAPIQVRLSRNTAESEHLVDACVLNEFGVVSAWGDLERPVIPRSAMKPIQVLPLVRSGAADAFNLSDAEIALGAASHSAEPRHVEAVDAWLDRIGLGRDALECGAGRPLSPAEADRRLLAGEQFESIHNCCSGTVSYTHLTLPTICSV